MKEMKDWLIETKRDKILKDQLEQDVIQYEFDNSKLSEGLKHGVIAARHYYPDEPTKQSLFLFAITKAVIYSHEILQMSFGTVKQEVLLDLVIFYGVTEGLLHCLNCLNKDNGESFCLECLNVERLIPIGEIIMQQECHWYENNSFCKDLIPKGGFMYCKKHEAEYFEKSNKEKRIKELSKCRCNSNVDVKQTIFGLLCQKCLNEVVSNLKKKRK